MQNDYHFNSIDNMKSSVARRNSEGVRKELKISFLMSVLEIPNYLTPL
jgi:hypothetical protein